MQTELEQTVKDNTAAWELAYIAAYKADDAYETAYVAGIANQTEIDALWASSEGAAEHAYDVAWPKLLKSIARLKDYLEG